MATSSPRARVPRRSPVQARSAETVAAICEAAMQLLLKHGPNRLTTVRIAQRAGVSVGTYYQYFPNKEALLQSLVSQHLRRITETLEAACKENHGTSLRHMVAGFVRAYIAAQLLNREAARIIYRVALDISAGPIIARERQLAVAAIAAMLRSSPELYPDDIDIIAFTFFGAVSGAIRAALDTPFLDNTILGWEHHLERLGHGYLKSFIAAPPTPASRTQT